uniref:Secreted luciferase n=1 Tax=Lucicutia ovaliformis TaxID=670709 RepID=U3THF2_9MAXI|nr:secreted luciferase [Lucicutia ovaliformis]
MISWNLFAFATIIALSQALPASPTDRSIVLDNGYVCSWEGIPDDLRDCPKTEDMSKQHGAALKLPPDVLDEMECNAKKSGCVRGCLQCLALIKCTAKMRKYIPGRCHSYEGDKDIAQGGIGKELTIDIPEIPGFLDLAPMDQFVAQVDLCVDCSSRCLKGLANVQCSCKLYKWLPTRCTGFQAKIKKEADTVIGLEDALALGFDTIQACVAAGKCKDTVGRYS